VILNPIFSFLLHAHAKYHVEHHMFPLVPFHSLAGCTRLLPARRRSPTAALAGLSRLLTCNLFLPLLHLPFLL